MIAALARRVWPHALVIAAILCAVLWIDRNAAERTRGEMEAARARIEASVRSDLRRSEQRLAMTMGALAGQVRALDDALAERSRTDLRPALIRELTRETRLSDPALGLSDGVREQLNRAIPPVACAARADGGIRCALPDAGAAARQ